MLKSRFATLLPAFALSVMNVSTIFGQDFPSKPIRLITQNVGGSGDFASRLIGPGITKSLGQPVVVENRSTIGAVEAVAKAPPDGYSLLLTGSSFWTAPLMEAMPYDPVRDFSPVTITHSQANVLVVHPSLPVKSVKELLAFAKARPGELNYSTGGMGSSTHLAGLLFGSMCGIDIVRVGYRGSGAATVALIGGEVQLMFPNAAAVAPYIKSGKLRALAVTTARPSALIPGLPTVAASGISGYESAGMTAIFAPAKTPDPIIQRLNQEIVRYLNSPEAREKFLSTGVEVVGSSPEELGSTMKSEISRLGKVIKETATRPD